jgi:hypothetical protein
MPAVTAAADLTGSVDIDPGLQHIGKTKPVSGSQPLDVTKFPWWRFVVTGEPALTATKLLPVTASDGIHDSDVTRLSYRVGTCSPRDARPARVVAGIWRFPGDVLIATPRMGRPSRTRSKATAPG